MTTLSETLGIDVEVLTRLLWTLIALLAVLVLRRVARRIVARNVELEESAYRANKLINYLAHRGLHGHRGLHLDRSLRRPPHISRIGFGRYRHRPGRRPGEHGGMGSTS